MPQLTANSYGKSAVRLTKVVRNGPLHTVYEFDVALLLQGAFDDVYTTGDNASCIPTDTMKNTVFALGKKHDFSSPEQFASLLTAHFLDSFPHVSAASASISQILWDRIPLAAQPHDHAFQKSSNALRTAASHRTRAASPSLTGGIRDLEVLKTTRSAFIGFHQDPYTTLKPTTDRILGTAVEAAWSFTSPTPDFNATFDTARRTLLETFASHDSRGIQQTMYAMGQALLAAAPHIAEVSFTMPNQHRLLVNLDPFHMTNENEIFVSASEPYGLIKATISR